MLTTLLFLLLACSDDGGDSATTKTDDSSSTTPTPTEDTSLPTDDSSTTPGLDGAQLYADTCAGCHGADGHGGSAPDLSRELGKTDAQLIEIILNGDGRMPPQDVTQEEAQAIVDWMRANI